LGRPGSRFWDHPEHEYEAWSREFQARYVDEALEDGFVVRAGPRSAGTNIVDLAAHYGFDMVIAVWSQLAPGTNAPIVLRLLAESPIPVLLVPSLATRAAAELEPEEDRAAG